MVFHLKHVKSLLESNSVSELRNIHSVISNKFKKSSFAYSSKLYESFAVTKTVKREILVEQYLPNIIENAVVDLR